jgi:hypothetical protein
MAKLLDPAPRMFMQRKGSYLVGAMAMLCVATSPMSGCSRGPARIAAPDWDPPDLAERIVTDLDKNADAQVDAEELAAAPGLAAGARFIDRDKNGQLSREEIEAQFTKYVEQRVGLRTGSFRLSYKGRPVRDAEVTFIPESFLEGLIEPAKGVTDVEGFVTPQTEGQDLLGIRLGYYRVQVTSPHMKIPEKYSRPDSPLGADVSLVEDASSYGAGSTPQLKLTD